MIAGLTHVSLFSGVGGFELAMAEAGIPTLAAAEIDKKARGVLHDRFPGVRIYHDVKEVTGDSLRTLGADPGRTVLTAGWPCQGNSVAGRRGGMGDARSGLWSEVVRVLAELRPAWFVGENVPGLLSVAGGRDFATVVGDLARLGYGFAWRVLDAQHFGVPQRRRRVVIVGRLGDSGRAPAQVLLEPDGGGRNPAEGITPRQVFARRADVGARVSGALGTHPDRRRQEDDHNLVAYVAGVASTVQAGGGERGYRIDAEAAAGGHLVAFTKTQRSGARDADGNLPPEVQGYPDDHTATSDGRPQADSARYKQHGNGIAVPLFAWVAKRLVAVEENRGVREALEAS